MSADEWLIGSLGVLMAYVWVQRSFWPVLVSVVYVVSFAVELARIRP